MNTNRCHACGAPLPGQALFCGECGAPVPGEMGDPGLRYAAVLPEEPGQEPVPTDAEETEEAARPNGKKKRRRGPVVFACVVLLLGVGAVLGILLLLSAEPPLDRPIVYLQDERVLRAYNSAMDAPVTVVSLSSGEHLGMVAVSPDGRRLLYTLADSSTGGGELYLWHLAGKETEQNGERGTRLSADVTPSFRFTPDSRYAVYVREDGGLYCHDFTDSRKLDSGVHPFGFFLLEGGRVLYLQDAEEGTYNLYSQQIGAEEDGKTKLDADLGSLAGLYVSNSGERVVFLRDGEPEGYLYRIVDFRLDTGDKAVAGESAIQLHSVDVEQGRMIYRRKSEETLDAFAYLGVEDDLAEADAAMEEPRTRDYPVLVESVFGERQTTDIQAFTEAWERYEAKLARDGLRAMIRELEENLFDVVLYEGGEERVLLSGLSANTSFLRYAGTQDSWILYSSLELGADTGPLRLSQLDAANLEKTGEMLTGRLDLVYRTLDGSTATAEPVECYRWPRGGGKTQSILMDLQFDSDSQSFLILGEMEDGGGNLYRLFPGGQEMNAPLDQDVNRLYGWSDREFLYLGGLREDRMEGTLLSLAGKDVRQVATDVFAESVTIYGDGQCLFYRDWKPDRFVGDLYLYDGQATCIAVDVNDYYYYSGNLIYLYKDYNAESGKGDLYLYRGQGQPERLDSGVTYICIT